MFLPKVNNAPSHINFRMPTKAQLSEEINEILGTEMKWSEMPKEDLELLHELIEEGALIEPMGKHIIAEKGKEKLEAQVDEWYPGKYAGRLM